MDYIISWLSDSLSNVIDFLKFLISLPVYLLQIIVTFPPFYRTGFLLILTILVIAVVVRIKKYFI